jgi:hypothetical protein
VPESEWEEVNQVEDGEEGKIKVTFMRDGVLGFGRWMRRRRGRSGGRGSAERNGAIQGGWGIVGSKMYGL